MRLGTELERRRRTFAQREPRVPLDPLGLHCGERRPVNLERRLGIPPCGRAIVGEPAVSLASRSESV
jgi:hypothetical protein